MTEKYYFFNSGANDPRTYEASHFADYFGSVLSTGLLHTDNIPGMSVSVETGTLNTIVSAGKAIMKGRLYENTSDFTSTHAIPEPDMDRIDRIVLRLNLSNAERNIKLMVLNGTSAATPIAPTLVRDNFIHDISLAQILVNANTAQLLQSDLTDERLDENLAGLVHSLISIPTSQFQAEWDAWFDTNTPAYESEWRTFMDTLTGQSPVMSVNGITPDVNGNVLVETGGGTAAEIAITDAGAHYVGTDVESVLQEVGSGLATHKADEVNHIRYAVASGTAKTYAVTLTPTPTVYVEGMAIAVKVNIDASGVSTLNVNGLGAKGIKKANGLNVTNLKANGIYTFRYDGTSFILQGEGASGNATASDLLSGKTASTDVGDIVGTMPNRGAFNLALGAAVPAGYYSGGAVPSGKKFASGTSNFSGALLAVRGLGFTPSKVLIWAERPPNGSNSAYVFSLLSSTQVFMQYPPTKNMFLYNSSTGNFNDGYGGMGIVANGFDFTLPSSTYYDGRPVEWIAYE